jgi:hypothetical protein
LHFLRNYWVAGTSDGTTDTSVVVGTTAEVLGVVDILVSGAVGVVDVLLVVTVLGTLDDATVVSVDVLVVTI